MGRPSAYSEEFRADAVRVVVDSTPRRSINDVAVELGLNREKVARLMREAGIEGRHQRRRRCLTKQDKTAPPAPTCSDATSKPARRTSSGAGTSRTSRPANQGS
ncbi:MAG TPA: hypothetical protein VFU74_11690 [Actinocrinis sp.]|nr:hypothetical protein [Actinocrinis sp.]